MKIKHVVFLLVLLILLLPMPGEVFGQEVGGEEDRVWGAQSGAPPTL